MSCVMTPEQVVEGFLASPPLISANILDLTVKHPNWLRDLPETEEFPRGNGTQGHQLIFRADMPELERGLDRWKKQSNVAGCDGGCAPDCGYNWTQMGGHGIDRKVFEMMDRDFRSPEYCVKEIQTTAHFEQIMAMTVQTLYRQVDFFKEINIGQNVLTMLAKKFVVDSGGAKPNPQDIYSYRPIGTTVLARLNLPMLRFFYEWMRKLPDCIPYDVINGSPIFALECSEQLLAELYRDDAGIRWDMRFSDQADDLIKKYNFLTNIQGMFLPAPILTPRRFNYDAVQGWLEVFPWLKGIPAEVGAYTGFNPLYEVAVYEEVLLHGRSPFKIFYMPTETTLGGNTEFGPEFSYFNAWKWVNPETTADPFRRKGYFATSASIGIAPQFSEGIFGIMVTRPNGKSMAVFYPQTACPPAPVVCSNEVPAVTCPCPLIVSVTANPIVAGQYFIQLSVPTTAQANATVQLGLDTGGYVTGTIVSVSLDGYTIGATLNVTPAACTKFTTIFCDNNLGCKSRVLKASDCRSEETGAVKIWLEVPIKAVTAGQIIQGTFGDGTTHNLAVVSADMSASLWTVKYAAGDGPTDSAVCGGGATCADDMLCDRCGIVSVCVPPSTDATCPSCSGYSVVVCSRS